MGIWDKTKAIIGLELQEENAQSMVQKTTKVNPVNIKEKSAIIPLNKTRAKANHEHIIAEIVIFEPQTHEDSLAISSHLKSGKPVIINLRQLDALGGKRLIDFVCGTAFAFEGNMQKIGNNIFLFTPANISICDMQERNMAMDEVADTNDNENSYYSHIPFVKDDNVNDKYIDPRQVKTDRYVLSA